MNGVILRVNDLENEIGGRRIVEGDCRDLIAQLPDDSIDLCLTSPPYALQRKDHYPSVSPENYPQFTVEWMTPLWDKMKDDGNVLIVIEPHVKDGVMSDYVRRTEDALCKLGWLQHQTQIWCKRDRPPLGHTKWPRHSWESILWFGKSKNSFCDPWACGRPSNRLAIAPIRYRYSHSSPGKKQNGTAIARVPDVWDVPVGGNEKNLDHPAMFPLKLAERLIRTFCRPGGTVLDPFTGSGTTPVVAKRLGYGFYGFEVMPKFCEMARRRLAAAQDGDLVDDDDVECIASDIGHEPDNLLLMNRLARDRLVAAPGKPGRKKETEDIAEFARLGRLAGKTWKEICQDWKRTHPGDKRVRNKEHIREAYRRFFGDKAGKGY